MVTNNYKENEETMNMMSTVNIILYSMKDFTLRQMCLCLNNSFSITASKNNDWSAKNVLTS